jgi:hypothetical protein
MSQTGAGMFKKGWASRLCSSRSAMTGKSTQQIQQAIEWRTEGARDFHESSVQAISGSQAAKQLERMRAMYED